MLADKRRQIVRLFAWAVFVLSFTNALYFVLRTTNPVISSDAWYFLDVFVRKALNGTLTFADFFVRRRGLDHAQPMFKAILWAELRYFDLDFSLEAIVGVLAAALCALMIRFFLMPKSGAGPTHAYNELAWASICAVIFSLNATEIWTWSLVTMEYLTLVPILVFWGVLWHALNHKRYVLLGGVTLWLGAVDDDSAVITVVAGLMALGILLLVDHRRRDRGVWTLLLVVVLSMVVIRTCYMFAPLVRGIPKFPLPHYLGLLVDHLHAGDVWSWFATPLVQSMVMSSHFKMLVDASWTGMEVTIALALVAAHGWFWWKAARAPYNLPIFISVCLMLLYYGWLGGILVFRVTTYGDHYLEQGRYVLRYQLNLFALLMMMAGVCQRKDRPKLERNSIRRWVPACGCVTLLLLQIPLSTEAWRSRPYILAYYHRAAVQLRQLAKDPEETAGCPPDLDVCAEPLALRKQSLALLGDHHLNVFSQRVQHWHSFLPKGNESAEFDSTGVHIR
ncbi:hypothetical protein EKH79_03480 [Dyella dinghuensis]|uniref:Transmembrane protein n=1 Tax=Dyella dinghuensis TaxID=1920169 RepID=A0A432LUX1_9GAMM|nr:hypothetical protein [Dyella dinghuensis]RUL65786.1 hypothetical protein EKH79_03480 [Dyella dinghuensis]